MRSYPLINQDLSYLSTFLSLAPPPPPPPPPVKAFLILPENKAQPTRPPAATAYKFVLTFLNGIIYTV